MATFVMMVDNEVVESYEITEEDIERVPPLERRLAILRSNPVIVETPSRVPVGHVWNGVSFEEPRG